jgi:PAS domain S-box-containing protein
LTDHPSKHRISLWRVFYAGFIGLLFLYLLISGYSLMVLDSVGEQAEMESLAATGAQARLGVLFVEDHQKGLLERLSAIVSRNSVKRALKNQDMEILQAYLLPLVEQSRETACALLADSKARVILQIPAKPGQAGAAIGLPEQTASNKPAPELSAVHDTPEGKIVTLSAPIWDESGGLLGYMAINQRPTLWQRYFSNFSARPGRWFYLFDQKDNLVAAGPKPDNSRDNRLTALAKRICQEVNQSRSPVTRIETLGQNNQKAFVSASLIGGLGWVLVVAQDYQSAMAPTRALSQNTWLFLLVLLICLVLMGFSIASRYRLQQRHLIKTDEQARRLEALVQERTADLKASNDRFRSLLEDLPDIVYEVDSKDRITLVSGAARNVLGYEPQEMAGKTMRSFVLPEDRHKFDEERARAEHGQAMSILALRHQPKKGNLRWLSIHSRGIRDGQGRLVGRRGVARDVTQRVLAEMQVHELSGKLINAQEEERKHLALDLHDELGQLLSALKIGLQSFHREAGSSQGRELNRLIQLSQTIMDRVRSLAYNLRPAILDNFGLAAAVQDLCESLTESGLLQVKYRLSEIDRELSAELKLPLFRCAQEALHNVVKHSGSTWAEVTLERRDNLVCLGIKDRGCGFDPQKTPEASRSGRHLGLLGMKERLRLVGGRLEISSSDRGTLVVAKIPLEYGS